MAAPFTESSSIAAQETHSSHMTIMSSVTDLPLGKLLRAALSRETERTLAGVGDLDTNTLSPSQFLDEPPKNLSPRTPSLEFSDDAGPLGMNLEGMVDSSDGLSCRMHSSNLNSSSHKSSNSLPAPLTGPINYINPAPTDSGTGNLTLRQKEGRKERRKRKRAEEQSLHIPQVRSTLSKRYKSPASMQINYSARQLPTTQQRYTGAAARSPESIWTLEELKGAGFHVIEWDGCSPHAIVDKEHRIIVMLGGRPKDGDWGNVIEDATSRLLAAGHNISTKEQEEANRRGNFVAINSGVTLGPGAKRPSNLNFTGKVKLAVDDLKASSAIRRVAGFQSSQFSYYYPKISAQYTTYLQRLFEKHEYLEHNFTNSIFPACSFNVSEQSLCFQHTDFNNWASGICPITSGGNYNPKLGGHLVLFDLKLVIEFPPGSTILIPSSTLSHGNTSIQHGETRVAFTQYAAGSLFRWVDYGFQTVKDCTRKNSVLKERLDLEAEGRWEKAMGLFSKLDGLHEDRSRVFHFKC